MLPADADAPRLVLSTCADLEEAERIARALVEAQVAACVNIFPGASSIYRWQGKIESSREVFLLIKTCARHVKGVEDTIASLHSYAVPEILVMEISGGSRPYLEWLAGSLK